VLIGREVELGRLLRALETARGGGSDVLVVRGEAGMGKTAVLDYALERSAGCNVA
jgi:predicted ATPase